VDDVSILGSLENRSKSIAPGVHLYSVSTGQTGFHIAAIKIGIAGRKGGVIRAIKGDKSKGLRAS